VYDHKAGFAVVLVIASCLGLALRDSFWPPFPPLVSPFSPSFFPLVPSHVHEGFVFFFGLSFGSQTRPGSGVGNFSKHIWAAYGCSVTVILFAEPVLLFPFAIPPSFSIFFTTQFFMSMIH